MCYSPITVLDPRFKRMKKYISVPCGKCYQCVSKKRHQWTFRLYQQLKSSTKGCYFVTLTYDNEHIPYKSVLDDNDEYLYSLWCFNKHHVSDFVRSLRDRIRYKGKLQGIPKVKLKDYTNFKYFCASEYGSKTHRPHYHILFFDVDLLPSDFENIIRKNWYYGFVQVDYLNDARLWYTTKYILKQDCFSVPGLDVNSDRNFILCSKNIGLCYLNDNIADYHIGQVLAGKKPTCKFHDISILIPRYYRDKIFDDDVNVKFRQLFADYNIFDKCPKSEVNPWRWLDNYISKQYKKEFEKCFKNDVL